MKKKFLIILVGAFLLAGLFVSGYNLFNQPQVRSLMGLGGNSTQNQLDPFKIVGLNIIPRSYSYTIGDATTSAQFKKATTSELCLSSSCRTSWPVGGGGGSIPFVAKGDLVTYDGATTTILSVGANGQVLIASSTAPDGIVWVSTSSLGIISGGAETDPIWMAASSSYYLASNPSGYISSFTETDPYFMAASSSFATSSHIQAVNKGGTGTTTAPSYGQLLMGNASGNYDLVATSALGIVGGGSQTPWTQSIDAAHYGLSNAGDISIDAGKNYKIGPANMLYATGTRNYFLAEGGNVNTQAGVSNLAIGKEALSAMANGSSNIAIGYQSLYALNNSSAQSNTAVGYTAHRAGVNINNETAIGYSALYGAYNTSYNSAFGANSGGSISTGGYNTCLGAATCDAVSTGSNNTFIGYGAGLVAIGSQRTNAGAIGYLAHADQDNSFVIGGTGANQVNVGIATTTPSSLLTVGAILGSQFLVNTSGGITSPTATFTTICLTGDICRTTWPTVGGGGATTTINTVQGPSFTFATGTDTNIGMSIATSSGQLTFSPYWIGTLDDSRITSASTWNAKQGALTFPLAEASTTHPTITLSGDVTGSGTSSISTTIPSGAVLLDELGNPAASKTFNMANKDLVFSYSNPVGSDGAFELDATGAFSGDLMHIHQHTGNLSPGTDMVHIEADDPDATMLRILSAGGYAMVATGGNVGIGTDTPSSLLTVGATSSQQFLVNTLGVVTGGTWNGAIIANNYGGTGKDSSGWTGFVKVTGGVWGTSTIANTDVTGLGNLATQNAPSSGIVTSNGTTLSFTANNSSNWDTAYSDRLKWDGGSSGLTAATGRTSLGLGTMALEANTGSSTITTLGTITTGVWNGTAINIATTTGTVGVTRGGTGLTSLVIGDILYASAGNTLSALASGTAGYVLLENASKVPTWTATSSLGLQPQLNGTGFVKAAGTTISYDNSTYLTGNQSITLTGAVSGTGATSITTSYAASVPYNYGGTGLTSWAKGDMLYASALNTPAALTVGATGTILMSNNGVPTWTATSSINLSLANTYGVIKSSISWTYSTSTWSGTSTLPLGPASTAETFTGISCFTNTGTVNVQINDGTNKMDIVNASTTNNLITLSTNNTFTANEKRYVDMGSPASSPTYVSCTANFTYDPH